MRTASRIVLIVALVLVAAAASAQTSVGINTRYQL